MPIDLRRNSATDRRGSHYGEFHDAAGWLFRISDGDGANSDQLRIGAYHSPAVLTQAMAADLIPLLEHFVRTGRLGEEPEVKDV